MAANNKDLALISEEMINKALEAARARIARAEHERAELDRVIASVREEERLLLRLLALRRDDSTGTADGEPTVGRIGVSEQEQRALSQATEKANHPVVEAVVRELATAGRPLHISELMRLLPLQGIQVPGAGTQANLITHLRRDSRLVRPSRGMYGLATWGLESMPTLEHRKRRKKRMRSKADQGRTK